MINRIPKLMRSSACACLAVLAAMAANAPSAWAESLLLSNAVVHTISGETLKSGAVLIVDGKIKAVGGEISGGGAQIMDLQGGHLYPAMIAVDTSAGLSEIEAVRATQDTTEVGEYHPDVESWIAVNPDSEVLPVTRANGIGYIVPSPQGGVVGGLSGVVALDGWTVEQMTIKHPAALNVYWPGMELNTTPKEKFRDATKYKSLEDQAKERQAKLKEIDDFFAEARAYEKARNAGEKSVNPPWEAMLPVVKKEIPIMIHADELRQIKSAIKWADTNGCKIIIAGGRDAWKAADLLAARQIPVVYESTFDLPPKDDAPYDVQFRAPEILRKAGVKVIFSIGPSSFNAPLTKNDPYEAAQAVAFGLPESDALKGLTLYPAEAMGVADKLGSIEPGKVASLFVADGSILDIRSNVKRMWIAGHEKSLETRHTRLYEKYRNRPRAN